ncbi:ATP synthase subunit alpha [Arachis hypogaea]|nr:ATP synthase subunit alpha [Arachis hypogaea]
MIDGIFIMEFSVRAAELTTLLESRITNFYTNFQVDEIGRVVSVGDGIARVYGLKEIQAGEMVEFASGVKGIALNLENERRCWLLKKLHIIYKALARAQPDFDFDSLAKEQSEADGWSSFRPASLRLSLRKSRSSAFSPLR